MLLSTNKTDNISDWKHLILSNTWKHCKYTQRKDVSNGKEVQEDRLKCAL